jgi:hypothetical protein
MIQGCDYDGRWLHTCMEDDKADALIADLENNNFGYALPKIYGAD